MLLFRGDDGLDELTTTTTSTVWVVRDGTVASRPSTRVGSGIPLAAPEELRGGDVAQNVAVARDLFAGAVGPVRDAVVLNAGAGACCPRRPDR